MIEWFADWFSGNQRHVADVVMYCPETGINNEDTICATDRTTPDKWDPRLRVGAYECSYCEEIHQFVWGMSPAPLYIGDGSDLPDDQDDIQHQVRSQYQSIADSFEKEEDNG